MQGENTPNNPGNGLPPANGRAPVRPLSPSEALEPARPPEPPTGRKRAKRWKERHPVLHALQAMLMLTILGLIVTGAVLYYGKFQFEKPGPLDSIKIVTVPQGAGVGKIAARLVKDGVISSRHVFMGAVYLRRAQRQLKAGEYEIASHASMRQVLDTLMKGKALLYKISIPEGLTSQQIVARVKASTMLTGEIDRVPAEGTLLPDTYNFSRGATRKDVIERMSEAQKKLVATLWPKRAEHLPFRTPEEALILASIVEKETGMAAERARVAGVFVNRLKRGVRLQSDPTIIYGLVGGQGKLGHPIRKSELAKQTPYNTYQIDGLPPTPIANPGRSAIAAVMRPLETKDLFFVADGTGGHVFAETLTEHNRNVAAWRKIEKVRAKERAKAEAEAAKTAKAEKAAKSEPSATAVVPGIGTIDLNLPGGGFFPSYSLPPGTSFDLPKGR